MRKMDLLQRLFFTALGAASIFYFIVKISLSHWKQRGILHEKPKFFWGNLKGVGQKQHIVTALQELYKKYTGKAPFIGFYAYLKPMVLVLDHSTIEHILVKDAHYFTERGLYYNMEDDPLSVNPIQLEGEMCTQLRKKLLPIFAAKNVSSLMPAFLKIIETYTRSLGVKQKEQENLNITKLVDSYNIDVISSLAFGLEGDSLLFYDTEFRSKTRSCLNNFSLLREYLAMNYPSVARFLQYRTYDQISTKYFLKLVDDKIKEREFNRGQKPNDFLQFFIELKRHENAEYRLDSKEIAAQAFSFLMMGLEACNSTMVFCLYELTLNPEIQEKTRTEILNVLKKQSNDLNIESVNEMHFLKQVLLETLRKHTPYSFVLRKTIADYEVPNSVFMLKKNNHLIIPLSAIHHDQRFYPQPHTFNPDRFDQQSEVKNSKTFYPFGAGPLHCMAQDFAELQMLIGLITLLRQYKFSPCTQTQIPICYDNSKMILTPQSDIILCVQRV